MGETRTAFRSAEGVAYQTIVLVEGYPNAITDGPAALAVAALAGTEWTAAIGGLQVQWDWRQSFKPWSPEIDVDGLSFAVMDCDDSDAFGIAVGGTGAGVETYLTAALPAYENGATTISVLNTTFFPASGTIWRGIEAITYTGKTLASFTGCTRGRYAPFKAFTESTNRFGRAQPLPQIGDGQGTIVKPTVTSAPRIWRGRGVAIYICRRVGDVLDVKSEAMCAWQGRIRDTSDATSGMTIVNCEDARAKVKETTLLHDQWSARARDGIVLTVGMRLTARDKKSSVVKTAVDLVVGTGTPSATHIPPGYYTLDQLADALNTWWASEFAAGRLNLNWTWSARVDTTDGLRSWFRWTNGSPATAENGAQLLATLGTAVLQRFMGFKGDGALWTNTGHTWVDGSSSDYLSNETPRRMILTGNVGTQVDIDDIKGTWVNNTPYFPADVINPAITDPGLSTAALRVDDGPIGLFTMIDADSLVMASQAGGNYVLDGIAGVPWAPVIEASSDGVLEILADRAGEIRLRQVAIIAGDFATVMTRLLASTGSPGYNGTYDVYPAQLGAAIPWEQLGTTWTDSIQALAESHSELIVVIEKPTLLSEKIACELLARTSALVLKDGCFKVATWGTPTAALATHVLTASNKASPVDAQDDQVTPANEDDDALVNVIKLEYDRDLKGGYRGHVIIRHAASIADLGEKTITIYMCNTFSAGSSSSIEALQANLLAAIEMFAYPLRRLKRTVDFSLFEGIAPGDFGTVSDDFARDPLTGARGLTNKPHLLLEHHVDYGGYEQDTDDVRPMLAEVELLIMRLSNISGYCPAAEVDITAPTGGYVVGTKVLTCLPHEHSLATETADAARFVTADKVRVIEVDPADPDNPETWLDTVQSQAGNTITLKDGPTGVAPSTWTATKRHRIVSAGYATAVTTQRANVYQADDADGLVADTVSPYAYGQAPQQAGSWSSEADTGAELVALHASAAFGDGAPLTTGEDRDVARLHNNLLNYRTAVNLNTMSGTVKAAGTGNFIRRVVEVIPIHIGPGELGGGTRLMRLRPFYRRGVAGPAAMLYATVCRRRPYGYTWTITDPSAPDYLLLIPCGATVQWPATSTTWGPGDFKDVSIASCDPLTGTGFLVLEAEPNVEIRGMAEMLLLNYVQAA